MQENHCDQWTHISMVMQVTLQQFVPVSLSVKTQMNKQTNIFKFPQESQCNILRKTFCQTLTFWMETWYGMIFIIKVQGRKDDHAETVWTEACRSW